MRFPGLHAPLMDGMKYITAPRGALHQYNSPELTSSVAQQQHCVSRTVTGGASVEKALMEIKMLPKEEVDIECNICIMRLPFSVAQCSCRLTYEGQVSSTNTFIYYVFMSSLASFFHPGSGRNHKLIICENTSVFLTLLMLLHNKQSSQSLKVQILAGFQK